MGDGNGRQKLSFKGPSLQRQGGLRAWPGQLSGSQEQHTLRASTDWIAGGRLPLGNPLFLFYLVPASQGFEEVHGTLLWKLFLNHGCRLNCQGEKLLLIARDL